MQGGGEAVGGQYLTLTDCHRLDVVALGGEVFACANIGA